MDNESRVTGWWVFAGILLAIAGFLNVIWGIAAVSNSKFFTQNSVYVVSSLHTWGWITMVIGAIEIIAAFSLFSGGGFGRIIGIIAGSLGAIEALAQTGTTPFWSICVFALCVIVVYQLLQGTGERRDLIGPTNPWVGAHRRAHPRSKEHRDGSVAWIAGHGRPRRPLRSQPPRVRSAVAGGSIRSGDHLGHDAAGGRRDLCDLGQPAGLRSRQLGDNELEAARGSGDPGGDGQLPRRPALPERRRRQGVERRLPRNLRPVAQPLAGVLQNAAVTAANRALANGKVQLVWRQANRAADQKMVSIVNGGKGAVDSNNGVVVLDLSGIIKSITDRLGLPDVSGKLPANVAHLTVLKSDQLALVQNGGKAVKPGAGADDPRPAALRARAALARGRRRKTLMTIGIAAVAAGVVVLAGRSVLETQTVDSLVKNPPTSTPRGAWCRSRRQMLSEIAGAFIVVGVPLILAAWFAGPSRLATRGRKLVAPVLPDEPLWAFGFVALIMILIFIWRRSRRPASSRA